MKLQNPIVVFVLGLFDTGYSVAHLLLDHSIEVWGFTTGDVSEIGQYSKTFPVKFSPNVGKDPKGFCKFLMETRLQVVGMNSSVRPILIPCSDSYVFWISERREELKSLFQFELPSPEIMSIFQSKQLQGEIAERAGLEVPKTWVLRRREISVDNCHNSSTEFEIPSELNSIQHYPLFLKGNFSYLWNQNFSVKGFVCRDKEDLMRHLANVQNNITSLVVQEVIEGSEDSLFEFSALIVDKKILGSIVTQKIRQFPPHFGVGSAVQVSKNIEVEKRALKLIEAAQLTGIVNMEFKIDPRDGRPRYIETNLRVWQQIELTRYHQAGNFALRLVKSLVGANPETDTKLDDNVDQEIDGAARDTGTQILWVDPLYNAYSLAASQKLGILSFIKSLYLYFHDLRRARIISCYYRYDLVPFFHKMKKGLIVVHFLKIWVRRWVALGGPRNGK